MAIRALLFSLFLCAGTAAATPVNLVSNGGFESSTIANNSFKIFYGNYAGWETSNGIEIRRNVAGAAYEGNNFAELDTTANSTIRQNLATVAGATYALSFAYSPRTGVGAASNPIDVYWNNQLLQTLTGSGAGAAGNVWRLYDYRVTATGNLTTLSFAAAGTSDSYGGSLDAVSVSAVPEPGSFALVGAALLAMGAAARRKRG